MKSLNVVLIGPPGSGKGTQAELLRDLMGFVHYSTGEVFRDQIARKTPVGMEVEEFVVSGRLVPDEVVLEVVRAFLAENAGRSVLYDGFPRTIPQAEGLDTVLAGRGISIDVAVLVDLADDEVVKRLTARRQCRMCSKIFNLSFSPPKAEGVCDECGADLYQRKDDSEATIRDRLAVYHTQTEPVIKHYEKQVKLKRVAGELGRDRVYADVSQMLAAMQG